MTVAGVEAEMLGDEIGRMQRETMGANARRGLKAGPGALRRAFARRTERGRSDIRVQALLSAFFSKDGEGDPKAG